MTTLFLIIFFILPFISNAQTHDSISNKFECYDSAYCAQLDTTSNLVSDYYTNYNYSLNRNYDYELINKKRKLEMWAEETKNIGFALGFGICIIGGCLAYDNNWSKWIYVPCGTVIFSGCILSSMYISKHLQKKADAINVSTIAQYNINNNFSVNAVHFSNSIDKSQKAIGIGVITSF